MKASKLKNLLIIKTNKFKGNWNEILKDNLILLNEIKMRVCAESGRRQLASTQ